MEIRLVIVWTYLVIWATQFAYSTVRSSSYTCHVFRFDLEKKYTWRMINSVIYIRFILNCFIWTILTWVLNKAKFSDCRYTLGTMMCEITYDAYCVQFSLITHKFNCMRLVELNLFGKQTDNSKSKWKQCELVRTKF